MHKFIEIYAIAAKRKGGKEALEEVLDKPKSASQLIALSDHRWLSCMAKCVFQAGFNWKVVDNMWLGFEEVFQGFDIGHCAMLNDDDIARLVSDKRIVRHGTKIRSVQQNAVFASELAKEYGGVGSAIANWPASDYVGLLSMLKKRGSRLGGNTGPYFLRFMGVDSFILSRDVVARLIAEGIIDGAPTSQKSLHAVQQAFNAWREESKRSFTEISRVLAMSTG